MKALALFSGGLDSVLAIKLIQEQGVEVIPLNFVSHFFGGYNEAAEKMAKQVGTTIKYVDFKDIHLDLIKNPPSGFGKHMNPCIDCHTLMFKKALSMLEETGASFIITGEVLGQRPMSQTSRAMKRIDLMTGSSNLIVRPLSALSMAQTKPEIEGWINREKLLGITGRGRTKQMTLAKNYGILEYPTPSGGCLLTVDGYANRLRHIKTDGLLDNHYLFQMTRYGRFFRLDKAKYVIISRNEEENHSLSEFKKDADIVIEPAIDTFGPHILIIGKDFTTREMEIIYRLFSRYSKMKGKEAVDFSVNGVINHLEETNISDDELHKYIVKQ